MNDVLKHQEDLISMAEEIITVLRGSSDVESVHQIKTLQDTLRTQYERAQHDARDLLKSTLRRCGADPFCELQFLLTPCYVRCLGVERKKELRNLEEEASEPHEAAFEAARADLEEQQLQLQETIKELKNSIMYV